MCKTYEENTTERKSTTEQIEGHTLFVDRKDLHCKYINSKLIYKFNAISIKCQLFWRNSKGHMENKQSKIAGDS